ncbi:Tetratricopeptide repeat-containing protein [Candidatus Fervidibacteria bacterium JGI MDM2 JNZ-1-D12]
MMLKKTIAKLTQIGQIKKALVLVSEMVTNEYQRQVLIGRIAWKLVEVGEIEDAIAFAQKLPRNFDKVSLYHRIAETLRQRGQKERAVALLNEALRLAFSLPEDVRKFVIAHIACSFARLGETKKALEVFNLLGMSENTNFRFNFVFGLAEGGDFEMALKFARQLPPERRNIAINSIAATAEHRGRKELAIKLRQEARTEQKW